MNEGNVIYSNILRRPSQIQRQQRLQKSKAIDSIYFCHQDCSVPLSAWKLTALVLSIICLVLLVSVGILATKSVTEEKKKSVIGNDSGNFTSSQETESYLGNLTFSQEIDKMELISGNSVIPQQPKTAQVGVCQPCEDNWHQYGANCYSASTTLSSWSNCDLHCSTTDSSFLKFNTEKEMDFVKRLAKMLSFDHGSKFWISIRYNRTQEKWTWLDDSAFTLEKVNLEGLEPSNDQCIYIKNFKLYSEECKIPGYCMLMSKETTVYSNVIFQSPTKGPRCRRFGPKRGSSCNVRCQGCAMILSPWKLTALVLGIISLVLLVFTGLLAQNLMKCHLGNLTSSQETDQEELTSVGKLQTCEDKWHLHGAHCYSPSTRLQPWSLCQTDCSIVNSSFLQLNSEKEMDFVKGLTQMLSLKHGNKFWIGLYYNNIKQKWLWTDDSAFTLDKIDSKKPDSSNNRCKYIENGQLHNGDCKEHGYCICKK